MSTAEIIAKLQALADDASLGPELRLELLASLARLQALESDFARELEREKIASLYQLAYGLSHEFNNPLANISSRAQALLADERDPERRRKLAAINAQAFRAHEMIADLMLFAKPPRLERQAIDLPALLAQAVQELAPLAAEQEIALTLLPSPALPQVSADRSALMEAVKAVIKNGLEALAHGGSVTLTMEEATHSQQPAVAIVVRDTGPGIAPEVRRHLFDPYFSGREAGRGLGLGLSKCYRIIDEHGGRIDVESPPGGGALFRLVVPCN